MFRKIKNKAMSQISDTMLKIVTFTVIVITGLVYLITRAAAKAAAFDAFMMLAPVFMVTVAISFFLIKELFKRMRKNK